MSRFVEWVAGIPLHTMIDQFVKATLLLLVAWAASRVLRGASASTRHQIWTAALAAILLMPVLSAFLPAWQVSFLPPMGPWAGEDVSLTAPASQSSISIVTPLPEVGASPGQTIQSRTGTVKSSAGAAPATAGALLRGMSLWSLFLVVWGVGAALLLARLFLSTFAAWRVTRRSSRLTDGELLAEVASLSEQLEIRSPVAIVENPRLSMPMAWGIFQQTILVPSEAKEWSAERRRVVLLHELAHLKRWDCQILWLARLALAVHWIHPLAWIAVRRLQAEREHACDDLVLNAGTRGSDYAQHLLDIARAMQSSLNPGWAMVAMARPSELEGRLLAILNPDLDRAQTTRLARLAMLVIVGLLVLPLASLQPRTEAQEGAGAQESAAAALPDSADQSANAGDETRQARLLKAFSAALQDSDAGIRAQAVHSLGSLEDPAAAAELGRILRSDDSTHVREQAAWALGMIEDPAAVPALSSALSDPSGDVRRHAAWALGMVESLNAVPGLIVALGDAESGVRQQAAWALGMIEGADAVEGLAEVLSRDSEAEVRKQAAWALGMIESPGGVDALIVALGKDSSQAVREESAWALGMIGAEKALDPLLDAMSDANEDVRRRALWAVGQINS